MSTADMMQAQAMQRLFRQQNAVICQLREEIRILQGRNEIQNAEDEEVFALVRRNRQR